MTPADPPADILTQYLIDGGLLRRPAQSTLPGWPAFVSSMPDRPDEAVSVYDTVPKHDGRAMNTGENFFHFGVQVIVRSRDYPSGWSFGHVLMTAFEAARGERAVYMGGERGYLINNASVLTGLVHLGQEKNKRELFSINLRLTLAALEVPPLPEQPTQPTSPSDGQPWTYYQQQEWWQQQPHSSVFH